MELALKATRGQVAILPGAATAVWHYQAELLAGDPASVVALPGSYLGPILRVRQGQRVRVRFANDLTEPSIVHWHGLLAPDGMDGHPRHAVGAGQSYAYDFQVVNRAGTYWFHPHPHGLTGGQAYRGLAGLLIVNDAEETALGLPQGEYDQPLVIQDRQFDVQNQLVYLAQGGGMMRYGAPGARAARDRRHGHRTLRGIPQGAGGAAVIIDASVVLKGFFPDEAGHGQALALIRAYAQEEIRLLAPTLLPYEVTNAVLQAIKRDRIDLKKGQEILDVFQRLGILTAERSHAERGQAAGRRPTRSSKLTS